MFDAIKSILYLSHTEQVPGVSISHIECHIAPVQPAPGACHKNDLAPQRPHPEHKNDITTSVVIKANCSSQHPARRVLLLLPLPLLLLLLLLMKAPRKKGKV